MPKRDRTRLVLLYHDYLLRDIVRHVFGADRSITILAELPADTTPLAEIVALEPDVVIVDRRMLGDALPAAVTQLLGSLAARHPRMRVIALSLAEAQVTVLSAQALADITVDDLVDVVHEARPKGGARPRRRSSTQNRVG